MTDADRIAELEAEHARLHSEINALIGENVTLTAERDALAAQTIAHDAAIRRATLERAAQIVEEISGLYRQHIVRSAAYEITARLRAEMDKPER